MKVVLLLAIYAALAHARTLSSNVTTIGVDECPQNQTTDWTKEWLMRHEDCNKFYMCVNGEPVLMRCYDNLYFNLTGWQCDRPENVDCEGRNIPDYKEDISWNVTSTITEPTTTPAEPTATTPITSPTEPTATAPTTSPTEPTATIPTETTTTTTTDPTTTITAPTTTTESAQDECPADPFIHQLLSHETDCHLFYYCVWGEKVLSSCPDGLHFNKQLQVCDYPNDAGCVVSTTSTTTTVLEESNSTLPTL